MHRSIMAGALELDGQNDRNGHAAGAHPRHHQASRRWRWAIAGMLGLTTLGGSAEWVNAEVIPIGDMMATQEEYRVGNTGVGQLVVNGGSIHVVPRAYVGYESSAIGVVTATGAGSLWMCNSELAVGYRGVGSLIVGSGGVVSNTTALLGYDSGSIGTATVTGDGSQWNCTGDRRSGNLYVGNYGAGSLIVGNGGMVSNNNAYVGFQSASLGTATVTGTGSQWNCKLDLYVGLDGAGALTVDNGGMVSTQTLYASLSDLHGNGIIHANGAVLDADLVFNRTHGLTQSLAFGSGGTLDLAMVEPRGSLGAGYHGSGALTISEGIIMGSEAGMLGDRAGATGIATVTGAGSQWNCRLGLYMGRYGAGSITVDEGGVVSNPYTTLGIYSGSTGTVTVTGVGSLWNCTTELNVGYYGVGLLAVRNGGEFRSNRASLGYGSGATGTVKVTGAGSLWNCIDPLYVGKSGTGSLTVDNGGRVIASLVFINYQSRLNLHVSGNDMLVLGNATAVGSIVSDGQINLFADAFLTSGSYTPIGEFDGRAMGWSGSGSCNTWGGAWDVTNHTFTVSAPTALNAGASDAVTTGERLLFTTLDGKRMSASFSTVPAETMFAASKMASEPVSALQTILTGDDQVLSAWDFTTNFTGGTVLLSFDLGLGLDQEDMEIWHYTGGAWSAFAPDMMTYDSQGILSFTVNSFSGYAVTAIPEPATLSLLALAAPALLRRRRA